MHDMQSFASMAIMLDLNVRWRSSGAHWQIVAGRCIIELDHSLFTGWTRTWNPWRARGVCGATFLFMGFCKDCLYARCRKRSLISFPALITDAGNLASIPALRQNARLVLTIALQVMMYTFDNVKTWFTNPNHFFGWQNEQIEREIYNCTSNFHHWRRNGLATQLVAKGF